GTRLDARAGCHQVDEAVPARRLRRTARRARLLVRRDPDDVPDGLVRRAHRDARLGRAQLRAGVPAARAEACLTRPRTPLVRPLRMGEDKAKCRMRRCAPGGRARTRPIGMSRSRSSLTKRTPATSPPGTTATPAGACWRRTTVPTSGFASA